MAVLFQKCHLRTFIMCLFISDEVEMSSDSDEESGELQPQRESQKSSSEPKNFNDNPNDWSDEEEPVDLLTIHSEQPQDVAQKPGSAGKLIYLFEVPNEVKKAVGIMT